MIDALDIMALPFLGCLILTGMHTYLGLHVIDRGVIFVDLALAQVAALGAVFAFLFGFSLHSLGSYSTSLLFSLGAAFLFSVLKPKSEKVTQEAIIGIIYAVAASGVILLLSTQAEGSEELKSLLVGHLLFVGEFELLKVAIIYLVITLVHLKFRDIFFLISSNPIQAQQKGVSVWKWDFLFYATFAVVITSSVELAGVLLVFSFLVIPAVCGVMLANSIRGRLLVGWGVGLIGSFLGLLGSYFLDLPTGAFVVVVLGCLFFITILTTSLTLKIK